MIEYTDNMEHITPDMLNGFFVGWKNPPSTENFIKILRGSYAVWLAIDDELKKTVGFITCISDGVLSAYIPLLEVLPEYQNAAIGGELVRRMLQTLDNFYMVDLICDKNMQDYYTRFGMLKSQGMSLRQSLRHNHKNKKD